MTIYHNPNCSTSRFAVETAAELGVDADIDLYLKTKPDEAALLELIGMLEDPPGDLVRKDAFFEGLGLDEADYTTPEAVAALVAEHPRLLQRPIIVHNGRAIIGRPRPASPPSSPTNPTPSPSRRPPTRFVPRG